jgi:hypothetical protein
LVFIGVFFCLAGAKIHFYPQVFLGWVVSMGLCEKYSAAFGVVKKYSLVANATKGLSG